MAATTGMSTTMSFGVLVVLPLALLAGLLGAIISPQALKIANQANAATTVQEAVRVWVNAGTGRDSNNGFSRTSAVATIQKAIDLLEVYSGLHGIIELDGTTAHDFGTNSTLDFFPLISRYGKITIRGRKIASQTGTIVNTTLSSAASSDGFLQLFSSETIASDYSTHVIQNLNTSQHFAVESNGANTIDIIGANSPFQSVGTIWRSGDTYNLFKVTSIVTWTGQLNHLASFSRVIYEGIKFVPATNTSQFIAPKYRDDAMIFRGCHFDAKGIVSYDNSETGETGLPLEDDPRPTLRGSVLLEACFVNGVNTESGVTPASALLTAEIDTKVILRSVWSNATQIACAGMFVVQGFLATNCPHTCLFASTGTFFAQGIKFSGASMHNDALYLRVGSSTNTKIRNVNADVASGQIVFMLDTHSFGEVSHINVVAPTTPYTIVLGENTMYRLYDATIDAQAAIHLQFLAKLDLYGTFSAVGASGRAQIFLQEQCEIHIGAVTSMVNHTGKAAPIMHLRRGSKAVIQDGATLTWSTDVSHPLILVYDLSMLSAPAVLENQNPSNPNSTVKCGGNAIGPMVTQNDFAAGTPEMCICTAI